MNDSLKYKPQFPPEDSRYYTWLELVNDGNLAAKAKLISFSLGDPEGFHLPLSVYSSISDDRIESFTNPGFFREQSIIKELIDPFGGIASLLTGRYQLLGRTSQVKSDFNRFVWFYHFGVKLLQIHRLIMNDPTQHSQNEYFPNYTARLGCYVSTATWKENEQQPSGTCWLAFNYGVSVASSRYLDDVYPTLNRSVIQGWSASWGLTINNVLEMKITYSKYSCKNKKLVTPRDYQLTLSYGFH